MKRLRIGDFVLVLVMLVAFGIWFGFDKVNQHRGDNKIDSGSYAFVVSVGGTEIHRSKLGQIIVCLPNEMFIKIEGDHDLGYDVVAS